MKHLLEFTGRTSDGKPVVRGLYRFYETEGLPLEVLLGYAEEIGAVPDWMSFVLEAVEAGMKVDRILAMLDPALVDTFGPAFRDVIMTRLRQLTGVVTT